MRVRPFNFMIVHNFKYSAVGTVVKLIKIYGKEAIPYLHAFLCPISRKLSI